MVPATRVRAGNRTRLNRGQLYAIDIVKWSRNSLRKGRSPEGRIEGETYPGLRVRIMALIGR